MTDDPNEKLKAEYVDEREDKSAWFLEVKERAKLSPGNCVEHYAPNKAAMALWLAAPRRGSIRRSNISSSPSIS